MSNLERLNQVVNSLPTYEDKIIFRGEMMGALSVRVEPKVWEEIIQLILSSPCIKQATGGVA